MTDGVGELAAPARLEVGQQVEVAAVVGAMLAATKQHDTGQRMSPAERAWDHVRGKVLYEATPAPVGAARRDCPVPIARISGDRREVRERFLGIGAAGPQHQRRAIRGVVASASATGGAR
jgi:hypothetical protein